MTSPRSTRARNAALAVATFGAIGLMAMRLGGSPTPLAPAPKGPEPLTPPGPYVAFGYNDLGMHCSQEDYSEICILPPFNTMRVQVLRRGSEPDILTEDVTVSYRIPGQSRAADKSNFWTYAEPLFGVALAPDVGLTGHGLTGNLTPTPQNHWEVTGIPALPVTDSGRLDPYQLAEIKVTGELGTFIARPVVPVSSEMSCSLCHGGNGVSMAGDILAKHDAAHGTTLVDQKPVLCASCHADPALGADGAPFLPNLSKAVHGKHADLVGGLGLDNECYACHPGIRTQCQRDIHLANGVECIDCHGDMNAVADPNRIPWTTLPKCGDCHSRPGFQFEQPGKLFKDSIGHGGVHCAACHGSPHAITPTITAADNTQALNLQGHTGVINTCTVCHTQTPSESFFHSVDD
ncbi:MAG: hypothetical protein KDA22_10685 [Phycisphaerales bacterium]|nr:hypothetical protein [Phycisphaerales bacterium]